MLELSQRRTNTRSTSKIYGQRRRTTQNIGETPWRTSRRRRGQTHCALSSTRVVGRGVGSVTKRLRSSTAAKVHGSASWHGMTCECAHRLHLVEASAGFDHGAGHSFLLLYEAKTSPGENSNNFNSLDHALSIASASLF